MAFNQTPDVQPVNIRTLCAHLVNLEHKLDILITNTEKLMSATTDLQAGQANIDKAVNDTATYLKNLAGTISGGVSAADAETIANDLNTQASALEALVTPAAAQTTNAKAAA